MNLTLQLSAELGAKLREQAKAAGKAPEQLALQALEDQLNVEPLAVVTLSPEQWVADFRAWAEGHRRLPHEADDSRESIYAGRGE
jgi:predicted transcriptional regulator